MLSHISQRMIKILKILSSTELYITSNELAIKLEVTTRTIRDDIKKLNYLIKDYDLAINSKRGAGYKVNYESFENLKYVLKKVEITSATLDINPVTTKDRIRYVVKKLLYTAESIKIETFMDELFISESTVKKDLQKAKTILNKYNIRVLKTNQGIYADGHEINKRFCIADYLIYGNKVEDNFILNLINNNSNHISDFDIRKIKEIILYHLNQKGMEISDDVLKQIAVHIAISVSRIKTNQYISLTTDSFDNLTNESEYSISKKIVHEIGEMFGLSFSDDEIAYITIHLIGNRISYKEAGTSLELSQLLGEDICNLSIRIIDETGVWLKGINLKDDEELLYGLGLHLKQLVNRLSFNMNIRNPLLNKIKIKYPLAFEAGVISAKTISKVTGFKVNENEIGFLALHFGAAIEKQRFRQLENKKKIALVCASGMATSELLLTKLSHVLDSDYYMIGAYALHQLDELMDQQPDIILTTVTIKKELNVPVVLVDSVLNDQDIGQVKSNLANIERKNTMFSQFLNKDLYYPHFKSVSKKEALEVLTDRMVKKGYINNEIKHSIFSRELISSTAIGNMVAIPHPMDVEINRSCVSTAILDKEIAWSATESVSIIFIIVLEEKWQPKFQEIFSALYDIVHSAENVNTLIKQDNFNELLEAIDFM